MNSYGFIDFQFKFKKKCKSATYPFLLWFVFFVFYNVLFSYRLIIERSLRCFVEGNNNFSVG